MGTMMSEWRPSWWSNQVHGSAWERACEAMRRDWTQTKHDLGVGGHEMNQSVADTVMQAAGKEHLPTYAQANPPKVIGEWTAAEGSYRYGLAAHSQYGAQYPHWTPELEAKLQAEWMSALGSPGELWVAVTHMVRRGYEYDAATNTWPRDAAAASTGAPAPRNG